MHALILTIHIVASICLIIAVLLQAGKGADIGAVFGGAGSQALFGSSGPADFLNKATRVLVVVFMLTSLTLGYFVTFERSASSRSVMNTPMTTEKRVPGAPGSSAVPQKNPAGPQLPVAPGVPVTPPQPAAPSK
jgi:preprotein translocase subunit SecG